MKYMKNNFTKTHLILFVVIFVTFTVLTFLATNAGVDRGADHNTRVFQTTIGVITGPMTGAISRGFQSCCTRCSLILLCYSAPILIFCISIQFLALPQKKWLSIFRMIIWGSGWFIWFLSGIVSFGHALN